MKAELEMINGQPILRLTRREGGTWGKRHAFDLELTDEQVNKIRVHTGATFA